jgi:hypothetical protein
LLCAAVALVVLFQAGLASARVRHGWRVAVGLESREAYLARREPTYPVGLWMAENLPAGARVIGQEHRGFYLPRPYTMELAHRRRTGLGKQGEPALGIAGELRARGFTHLLLARPVPEDAVEFDPTLSRRLGPWLADREALYRRAIRDPDGVTRLYEVYELPQPAPAMAGAVGQGGETRR